MTVKEFYSAIGADYEQILGRMMGMEAIIKKFLKKFLQDPTFESMVAAVEHGSCEEIFIAAHTMKGIAGNLELLPLYKASSALTELTRSGTCGDKQVIADSFSQVSAEYKRVTELIERID